MIRVLVLVPKRLGVAPGQRFRLEQWAPLLASRHGISLDFDVYESAGLSAILSRRGHTVAKGYWSLRDSLRRAHVLRTYRRYDAVLIYREAAALGPAIYERLLARAGVPLVFDFDDAIWVPFSDGINGIFRRLRVTGKTGTICRLSAAVMAGNEYLGAYAGARNDNVHIVPTTIDLEKYRFSAPRPASEPFVITWSGSTTTLSHLETARPALEAFARRRDTRLRVICNRPPATPFAGMENVFVPWRADNEVEMLGDTDIGIMPLPDDVYTRGKCGLKALQYMATGRAVVVSPVGVNEQIIAHGQNGMVARTPEEWVAALEALAGSKDFRDELAIQGRRTVEQRYSAEVGAELASRAIRSALQRRVA